MATINKALTTYLPTDSVEWLEKYCLEFKHLVNKDGNPKLGTALADIVSRLADGGLTLPARIEQLSTAPDTSQCSTEINELKSEVDELKKLVDKVLCNNVPSTVPDSIGLAEVKSEIDKALEPINEAIEALRSEMVQSIEPQEHPTDDTLTESKTWAGFCKLLGLDTTPQNEWNAANGKKLVEEAKEKGLGDWVYDSSKRKFVKVSDDGVESNVEN
jgi:ElaB/YqjD/DUF883 family membrane-anchored ribosome-binding protein